MGKPEAYVEEYLKTQAEMRGYLCLKFTSPGSAGVPDRILIGHGEIFFVETKAKGQTTRAQQDTVISDMREHGAIVYVADTREKVDAMLAEHTHGTLIEPKKPSPDLKPAGTVICRPKRQPKGDLIT